MFPNIVINLKALPSITTLYNQENMDSRQKNKIFVNVLLYIYFIIYCLVYDQQTYQNHKNLSWIHGFITLRRLQTFLLVQFYHSTENSSKSSILWILSCVFIIRGSLWKSGGEPRLHIYMKSCGAEDNKKWLTSENIVITILIASVWF